MKIRTLHPWNLQYREALAVQERLSRQICEKPLSRPIRTVAGADVSYHPRGRDVYGAVLVFAFPDLVLTDRALASDTTSFPYVAGLLSFREAPVLERAFSKLATTPDVIIFDGQGIAHPRGMGLASHMGLILDCPTIGCAKTRLVGSHRPPGQAKGSTAPLNYQGRMVGAVVRTRAGIKPVFVSSGHAITLAEAISLILDCSRGYRLPEPVRQAHLAVNRHRLEADGHLDRVNT
ncbi:MAG: deoxyribonuclease V [Thermodesulfobacteriota bacterium]|nr:deoxyribonuclease V [Thermodesulfobacteriota bacterium]